MSGATGPSSFTSSTPKRSRSPETAAGAAASAASATAAASATTVGRIRRRGASRRTAGSNVGACASSALATARNRCSSSCSAIGFLQQRLEAAPGAQQAHAVRLLRCAHERGRLGIGQVGEVAQCDRHAVGLGQSRECAQDRLDLLARDHRIVRAGARRNYLVLAEILQRVTGRSLARRLRERIFGPLGLRATAYESGRRMLRGDQMHGYDVSATPPRDVSLHGLGGPWADGAIVSNARDLAVFFGAVLRGQLVPPKLVARMRTIVPRSHGEGMGLYRLGSPCGRWFYGQTGGTPGYLTFAAGSVDGRRMFVLAVNGVDPSRMEELEGRYLDDLLCRP
jgi:hypothetical protein